MTKKELAAEVAALRAEVDALRAELRYASRPVVPQPYPVPYYPQTDWWRPMPNQPIITCSTDANTTAEVHYIGSAS